MTKNITILLLACLSAALIFVSFRQANRIDELAHLLEPDARELAARPDPSRRARDPVMPDRTPPPPDRARD
jgi:hypothetical protein